MAHHFFAYMARMKHIHRWGLMRNVEPENDQEHSLQVAMIAHGLALLRNIRHGGNVDIYRVLALSVYHEAGEVITGDVATPIKYFNPDIREAFKDIEKLASQKLMAMIPEDLKEEYAQWLMPDEESPEWKLVKAADRICAYLKCVQELKAGNREFEKALSSIEHAISQIELPEVQDFMREFAPSFALTLDELN